MSHPEPRVFFTRPLTMIKTVTYSLGFSFLFCASLTSEVQAQASGETTAVNEAVYRQANHIKLRQKLADAQAAQARGNFAAAAKLYDDTWELEQKIGAGVDQEKAQTQAGLSVVRLQLAKDAQARGEYRDAKREIDDVLRVNPADPAALAMRKQNDQILEEWKGRYPSEEAKATAAVIAQEKVKTDTEVQDARVLFDLGKYDEAEAKLKRVVAQDPNNQAAYYYLNLIKDARFRLAMNRREDVTRDAIVQVEQDWATPSKRDLLAIPNPYRTTNLVY